MQEHYVIMTDRFMSDWGASTGKTNKLVIVCDSELEANIVYSNAINRGDMDDIMIKTSVPYYNKNKYLIQYKTKTDYPNWFKLNATWG